jgi:hypothetical protein
MGHYNCYPNGGTSYYPIQYLRDKGEEKYFTIEKVIAGAKKFKIVFNKVHQNGDTLGMGEAVFKFQKNYWILSDFDYQPKN